MFSRLSALFLAKVRDGGDVTVVRARTRDMPVLHSYIRGLDLDIRAVTAALTLLFHNGRTEGVNTR